MFGKTSWEKIRTADVGPRARMKIPDVVTVTVIAEPLNKVYINK